MKRPILTTNRLNIMIVGLGMAMWAVALFYQYVMGDAPCVLCVHVRAWLTGVILCALLGCAARGKPLSMGGAAVLTFIPAIIFLDKTYSVYAVEAGIKASGCQFDAGFPSWLALDDWAPALFAPQGLCGTTPDLLFGFTMGQGLLGVAILLLALCAANLFQGIALMYARASLPQSDQTSQ